MIEIFKEFVWGFTFGKPQLWKKVGLTVGFAAVATGFITAPIIFHNNRLYHATMVGVGLLLACLLVIALLLLAVITISEHLSTSKARVDAWKSNAHLLAADYHITTTFIRPTASVIARVVEIPEITYETRSKSEGEAEAGARKILEYKLYKQEQEKSRNYSGRGFRTKYKLPEPKHTPIVE